MRLHEFVEEVVKDEQDIAIICKETAVFNGLAIDVYKERKGSLEKFWKAKINVVKSAYDIQTSYLVIVLDDRYIMD